MEANTLTAASFDLVILGGGIMGLCAADEAKRRAPDATIAVFDRGRVGSGASGYAPGIQIAWGKTEAERRFASRGIAAWDRFFAESGEHLVRRCELIWLASDANRVQERHLRPPLPELTDLGAHLPSLDVHVPPATTILADRGSYSPVLAVTAAMRSKLARLGCRFFEGTEVHSIDIDPAHITLTAGDTRMLAGAAVVALGPWAPRSRLLRGMRSDGGPLRVKKVVALHLAVKPTARCEGLVLFDHDAFLIPMVEEAYWLFSFTSQHWDVRPGPGLQVTVEDLAVATPILERWAPELAKRVASSRVFCDCYSVDAQPRVELHRESDRVVYIVGGAGNGFRFAPPCAEDAIELLDPRTTGLP